LKGSPILADDGSSEDALAKRIEAARAAETGRRDGAKRAESASWSVATEFVGAMLAGGFIGWFIDRQFDTGPWGLIGLLLLGFVTGLRTVLRKQVQDDDLKDGRDE
jgi:ATP synthase protein I